MKFRFRLQRVLDFAQIRERRKQNQLNASKQREEILGFYIEKNRSQIQESLKRIAKEPSGALTAVLVQNVEFCNGDVTRLTKSLVDEKESQERIQKELVKLVMRRKSLEALKDKRYADFRVEQRHHEQKVLDEVSNNLWQRNRNRKSHE